GALAGLILIVGFARAIFAAKGWDYYAHNAFFWAKIGTFAVIGLLSIPPTLAFLKWRRKSVSPTHEAVARVRRYLWLEVMLFALLPAFAAVMARGYGEFSWIATVESVTTPFFCPSCAASVGAARADI